jgi:hypothetical protein
MNPVLLVTRNASTKEMLSLLLNWYLIENNMLSCSRNTLLGWLKILSVYRIVEVLREIFIPSGKVADNKSEDILLIGYLTMSTCSMDNTFGVLCSRSIFTSDGSLK